MKKYSMKRAGRGKTAYRTPSRFIYKQYIKKQKQNENRNRKYSA